MSVAPMDRATGDVMMPIGPAPLMSTRALTPSCAFWTAQIPTDSGSHSAGLEGEVVGNGVGGVFVDGRYWVNAPSSGGVARNLTSGHKVVTTRLALLATAAGALRLKGYALSQAKR